MAGRLVLADAADGRGEALGEDDGAEQLPGVLVDLLDGGALVAPVEVAQEVAPVLAVERQQAGRLGQRPQREPHAVGLGQAPGGQPRVALHHVGGDERVLQVEGGEVALLRQHLAPEPVHAVLAPALARRRLDPGVLDDRGQVHLADVGAPVDDARVEPEGLPVVGRERLLHRRGGGRPSRAPRTRRSCRRARRSPGPAPARSGAPRAGPTTRPACPAAAASGAPSRTPRAPSWPASAGPAPCPARRTRTRWRRWAGRASRTRGARRTSSSRCRRGSGTSAGWRYRRPPGRCGAPRRDRGRQRCTGRRPRGRPG